jgi:hypothetical protein
MAESIRASETIKRMFDANLRYYEALSRVTTDYIRALTSALSDSGVSTPWVPTPTPTAAKESLPPSRAALVLEAEAGQLAQGVFMVDNRLSRVVTATVTTSAFATADGHPVWPTLRVQPGTVTLQPGARALVQIAALIDDALVVGTSYQGEVSVSGLSDTPIPVVLRRLPSSSQPSPPPPLESDVTETVKPGGRPSRRKRVRR